MCVGGEVPRVHAHENACAHFLIRGTVPNQSSGMWNIHGVMDLTCFCNKVHTTFCGSQLRQVLLKLLLLSTKVTEIVYRLHHTTSLKL